MPKLAAVIVSIVVAGVSPVAGADFQHMPVGCKWHVKYSDGSDWASEFLGKKAGKFVVETHDTTPPKALISTTEFDDSGRMTKRVWATGKWEAFKPFSCFEVMGACRYTYSNADGAKQVIDSKIVKQGDSYVSMATPKGGSRYPDETITFGPFGMLKSTKSENYSTKITKFENCGQPTS